MDINTVSPYIRIAMYSTLAADCVINPRVIYDYEMIFVKGGQCRINIEGKDYICKENNVVLLRPGIVHSFHCDSKVDFIQPHIHFDLIYDSSSALRTVSFKNKDEMNAEELSLIQKDFLADEDIPFVFTPYDISAFQKLFFSVVNDFIEGGEDNQLILKAGMIKILDMVFSQFKSGSSYDKVSSDPIFSVRDYIDNNFMQAISLDALAAQFYMNKFTMMRQFKALFGENIINYCNIKKLGYACDLLKNTNLSVHSIGEMLGYSDAYSFSRFFKKIKGVSPVEYKKRKRFAANKNGIENHTFI